MAEDWDATEWRRRLEQRVKEMACPMCRSALLQVQPRLFLAYGFNQGDRPAEVRCLDCGHLMLFVIGFQ
jgi:hypothetical protein